MIGIKLDNYEKFKESVKQAAERFKKLDKLINEIKIENLGLDIE